MHRLAAALAATSARNSLALTPGSDHRATIHGSPSAGIAPGASVWTDPVPIHVRPGDHVSVSVYAPGAPIGDQTFPPPQTDTPGSFLSTTAGDVGADETGSTFGVFKPGTLWWVDAVSAMSPAQGTIATLGESITHGTNAYGGGPRWSDVRAHQRPAAWTAAAIANAGISGNTGRRCGRRP
jgi:hypothetical protein